tara:strand:+ start:198 stop:569 length:372 start_codon:yes stop_codon:yes gene_type:complete
MAQGDAYIYHWTSYNNNNLSLQPSSGVEWMFTASAVGGDTGGGNDGVAMNTTNSGSSYRTTHYIGGQGSSSDYYVTRTSASGGHGVSTYNMKLLATNSYPLRYSQYGWGGTAYSRFMAIVINE